MSLNFVFPVVVYPKGFQKMRFFFSSEIYSQSWMKEWMNEWMYECTCRLSSKYFVDFLFFFVDSIWVYIEEDTLLNFDRAYFTIQLRLSHFRIMCTWPFSLTAEWDLGCIIIILLHLRKVFLYEYIKGNLYYEIEFIGMYMRVGLQENEKDVSVKEENIYST